MVSIEDNTVDSRAFYFCNSGYGLQGNEIRVCRVVGDGTADWSGEEPTCESKLRWKRWWWEGGKQTDRQRDIIYSAYIERSMVWKGETEKLVTAYKSTKN